jgi:hypothetical protein
MAREFEAARTSTGGSRHERPGGSLKVMRPLAKRPNPLHGEPKLRQFRLLAAHNDSVVICTYPKFEYCRKVQGANESEQVNDAIPADPRGFRLTGRFLRICLPALLWTIVATAAPVFISQIHHSDRAIQEDFTVYYFLALEMRHGIDPYSINVIDQGRLNGLNIHGIIRATDPPTFLVAIMGPLTLLPIHTAYWIWQCVNMFCLIAAMYTMIGPRSGLPTWAAFTLAGLVALYPPVASHFWFGQSKFILLALLVLMMRSMRCRRNAIAGAALALAVLMRVFPIVITGYLLLTRRWRALGWTTAAMIFGAAVTLAFTGSRYCLDFVAAILTISNVSWNMIQRDLAAPVFMSRQLRVFFPNAGLGYEVIRHLLIAAVDGSILAATTLATLALPENEDPDARIFSLWVAAAVFLLPVAWDYDLTLMLISFSRLAVVAARGEASRRAIATGVLSYALLVWWEYVSLSDNELGFFAMLTAYISAYWLAVDQPGAVRVPIRSMPAEICRRLLPAT